MSFQIGQTGVPKETNPEGSDLHHDVVTFGDVFPRLPVGKLYIQALKLMLTSHVPLIIKSTNEQKRDIL